jgi:hypothetical protein
MISAMRVTINDDEEVEVGDDTAENFWLDDPEPVNDAVFKCPACQTGTVHQGYEFTVGNENTEQDSKKRVYLCSNCGRVSTR